MKRTFFLTAIVVITLSLMSFSCEKETTQGLNKDKIEMLPMKPINSLIMPASVCGCLNNRS